MRAKLATVLFCLFLLEVVPQATAESHTQNKDEAAIRELETRQQDAWNRHDAKAYADLFSEDGDVVNVMGWWWRGAPKSRRSSLRPLSSSFAKAILR